MDLKIESEIQKFINQEYFKYHVFFNGVSTEELLQILQDFQKWIIDEYNKGLIS